MSSSVIHCLLFCVPSQHTLYISNGKWWGMSPCDLDLIREVFQSLGQSLQPIFSLSMMSDLQNRSMEGAKTWKERSVACPSLAYTLQHCWRSLPCSTWASWEPGQWGQGSNFLLPLLLPWSQKTYSELLQLFCWHKHVRSKWACWAWVGSG